MVLCFVMTLYNEHYDNLMTVLLCSASRLHYFTSNSIPLLLRRAVAKVECIGRTVVSLAMNVGTRQNAVNFLEVVLAEIHVHQVLLYHRSFCVR